MFPWLKDKENNIVTGVLTIFVGGWLMLFSQTCFATLQDTGSTGISKSITEYPCDTTDNKTNKFVEHHNSDCDHCLDGCDYGEVMASLNTIETTGHLDKFHKLRIDSAVAPISFSNKTAFNLTLHISPIPELAILLPRQRYAILLV